MTNIIGLDPSSEYRDKWTGFGELIDEIRAQLVALPDQQNWEIYGNDGTLIGGVTVTDFIHKLDNMTWQLTDKTYSAQNGGVGAVVSVYEDNQYWLPEKWLAAHEEINEAQFDTYLANGKAGACYLILHEIAHTTLLGLETNNGQFKAYRDTGGDPASGVAWAASEYWTFNEQVANEIATIIADTLDLPELTNCFAGLPCGISRAQLDRSAELD